MPTWVHHMVPQRMRPSVRARELARCRFDALPRMPTARTKWSSDDGNGEWYHKHCRRENAACG
eukprot:5562730-Lingulodinium_polyedra.AAC.1